LSPRSQDVSLLCVRAELQYADLQCSGSETRRIIDLDVGLLFVDWEWKYSGCAVRQNSG